MRPAPDLTVCLVVQLTAQQASHVCWVNECTQCLSLLQYHFKTIRSCRLSCPPVHWTVPLTFTRSYRRPSGVRGVLSICQSAWYVLCHFAWTSWSVFSYSFLYWGETVNYLVEICRLSSSLCPAIPWWLFLLHQFAVFWYLTPQANYSSLMSISLTATLQLLHWLEFLLISSS